mmetsp:Transcript_12192/g.25153  ORF Transcript_12192/g.25153 Transcript_12192/m.25153 type:complete len:699 (+) Transcript_12192:188-2284(+)
MSGTGSRNSSGHSRQSGSNREYSGRSINFNNRSRDRRDSDSPPPPVEQGVEVIPSTSRYLSTSHAGVMRRKDGSSETAELTLSQHAREDLEVVPEAAGHLERPSINTGRPPLELQSVPYDDYSQYSEEYNRMDGSMRGQDAFMRRMDLMERSERSDGMERRVDRSGQFSREGSVSRSVVSDVSYGDKPYHSMPVISLAQDSGSLLPHLNTSHKSTCSMTHGSKRMAEKRAAMLRSGSILYSDETQERKKKEDLDLTFTRWGGRKDYSAHSTREERKRKAGLLNIHKRKVKMEKRKSIREQEAFLSKDDNKRKHGFHDLWGFAFKQDQLEYDQLIKEDKDRELVASYCEEPFWKIIFHFKGTVLRVIIEDILFWLTLATYSSIRIRFHLNPEQAVNFNYQNLSQNLVYVGGFLLFFLVFYVNQNHHRYFQLHHDSMVLMGRVNDVSTLVKAILPMERARRINRYMNAAHVAMYTGLSSTYEKENFFDPLEARFALLTDEELYRIVEEIDVDNSGPKSAFEIITWIMCDIRDAQINSFIDTNEAMQLREQLLEFRSTIAKIFVTTTLPIPFFYVHFLSLLTAVFLPLFAVVVAYETGEVTDKNTTWVAEIVSALVVFLQALFVIGLRILGQQLSDPFGGDLIDLQIARYVNMILNGSNQILAAKRLQPPSVETELRLQLKMSSLGQAFEYDTDDEVVVQH